MHDLTSVELFAGAGGQAYGLAQAGIIPIVAVENNPHCVKTLQAAFPNTHIYGDNILNLTELSPTEVRKQLNIHPDTIIDLLSGSPPCQSFSSAGKRTGLKDSNGNLFYAFIKMITLLNPRMFLIENSPNLTKTNQGQDWQTIHTILKNTGYKIDAKILDATDYGVPQKRKRIFIIGTQPNLQWQWPTPILTDTSIAPHLENTPNPTECYQYPLEQQNLFNQIPPGGNWKNIQHILKQNYPNIWAVFAKKEGGCTGFYRRLHPNQPSLTLLTHPAQRMTQRCHPHYPRPLSILEYKRIQTFPDNYPIQGTLTEKYRQIGNAVPPKLAYYLGKNIKHTLEKAAIKK